MILGRAQNVDDDHDTFVEKFHEDVIDQRRHQAKEWGSERLSKPQIRLLAQNRYCPSRQLIMMLKIRCKLSALLELCSGDEGHR